MGPNTSPLFSPSEHHHADLFSGRRASVPLLTVDGGLLRQNPLPPSVQTLLAWESHGRVELYESDRARSGGRFPSSFTREPKRSTRSQNGAPREALSFLQVSLILFPRRDPQRLGMAEINDVAHLLRHHLLGHAIFVTANTENFIDGGKRERLKAAFGLVVLTPEEVVATLEDAEPVEKARH